MKRIKVVLALILIVVLNVQLGVPRVKTSTPTEIADSINKGIAWLAAQQNPDGSWGTYSVGETGLAVLKLETYATDSGKDPLGPSYAYYHNVSKGLDYIFSNAHNVTIGEKTIGGQPLGNPDTNNNGWGVEIYSSEEMYETGISAMAIAASQHPERVISAGSADVIGRNYSSVLTDIVDFLAWAQNNVTDQSRGGWGYTPQ